MTKEVMKLGFELSNGELHVFDPKEPECRIKVDQILFDAAPESLSWDGRALGYAVAVHGLPLDVADPLPSWVLRHLGVGAQFQPARRPSATCRYRASTGDTRFEKVSR